MGSFKQALRSLASTFSSFFNMSGKRFKCGHCGFEHDADINAAKNIAALGLSVIQPESPGMTCQIQGQLALFGAFDLG